MVLSLGGGGGGQASERKRWRGERCAAGRRGVSKLEVKCKGEVREEVGGLRQRKREREGEGEKRGEEDERGGCIRTWIEGLI